MTMDKKNAERKRELGKMVILTYPDTVELAKEKLKGKDLGAKEKEYLEWVVDCSKKRDGIIKEYLEVVKVPGLLGGKKSGEELVDRAIDKEESKRFLEKELDELGQSI